MWTKAKRSYLFVSLDSPEAKFWPKSSLTKPSSHKSLASKILRRTLDFIYLLICFLFSFVSLFSATAANVGSASPKTGEPNQSPFPSERRRRVSQRRRQRRYRTPKHLPDLSCVEPDFNSASSFGATLKVRERKRERDRHTERYKEIERERERELWMYRRVQAHRSASHTLRQRASLHRCIRKSKRQVLPNS